MKKKDPAAEEAKKDLPIPKKTGGKQEEGKAEPPQARTSNMDALKAQIMLRKQAMNPGNAKKGEDDDGKKNNLAARSMKMSKFAQDVDEDEEESSSSESDDD